MEHVCCSLCGAAAPRPWLDLTDRFSGQSFQLVTCSRCGLVYSASRPTMAEIADYYPHDYEAYQRPAEQMSTAAVWHAHRMWEMQVAYVERWSRGSGSLLDIGCATGEFLDTARKHGWQVSGIEMVEQTAQIARQRYGLDVRTGQLEADNFPEGTFEVITMWDVFEHLPDPVDALRLCQSLLKPEGLLVMSIPHLASFDRYLFGRSWIGWDAPRHFTLFTTQTLTQAFTKTGFSMIDTRCFLGGKGTFLLSLDIVLDSKKYASLAKRLYPAISALLWPYRQLSYLVNRGPILAVAARKI